MITVYTITYNEALLIQFMIDHYRERFPNCRIVVYDNMSTDDTVKIALANNCEVIPFDTGGQFQDRRHMDIKNSCWKEAKTDWVLTCDLDELLDITEAELKREESLGTSMIRCELVDMVNMGGPVDIPGMRYGVIADFPGKYTLFNKKLIREINYSPGAHECNPMGTVRYSSKAYRGYHYASLHEDITIEKFKIYRARLSQDNIDNNWGIHYFMTLDEIRKEYADLRSQAIKVR